MSLHTTVSKYHSHDAPFTGWLPHLVDGHYFSGIRDTSSRLMTVQVRLLRTYADNFAQWAEKPSIRSLTSRGAVFALLSAGTNPLRPDEEEEAMQQLREQEHTRDHGGFVATMWCMRLGWAQHTALPQRLCKSCTRCFNTHNDASVDWVRRVFFGFGPK